MSKEVALTLHATVPVLFRPLAPEESLPARDAALAQNLRVFQACEVFEERPAGDRGEVDPAIAHELRRLDLKMTLLLELILEMMRKPAEHAPAAAAIELDFRGVSFSPATSVINVAQKGWLDLYIHPSVPRPLAFLGVITRFDGATRTARFDFAPLQESESDQLERLIFRHHRRKIADSRGMKRPL